MVVEENPTTLRRSDRCLNETRHERSRRSRLIETFYLSPIETEVVFVRGESREGVEGCTKEELAGDGGRGGRE